MSAVLKNEYGTITYDEGYLATVAGLSATESYGLVGMNNKHIGESIVGLFTSDSLKKGVDIKADGSENIVVKLYVTMKYGVSLSAVAENIIDKVKYTIEKETGLNVDSVDILVQSIQV
ncbi:Asp23/Gls24 family envelope stress response protein [Christensenellaceae bacterium OttesenSCG-928-K19]|nr:Asp23/Gls24 family envelope stress response protein [Christensenellaceae bacterium OttesenSCG-928-K19]